MWRGLLFLVLVLADGWPGSGYFYDVHGDPQLYAKSWYFQGQSHIQVCARPPRYGQQLELRLVWSRQWAFRQTRDMQQPVWRVRLTKAAPCTSVMVQETAPGESWAPDVRREWQTWLPRLTR